MVRKKLTFRTTIILLIVFCILLFLYLSFSGIQSISTNKDIYSVGEKVVVSWSDFRLYRCSCAGPSVKIYQEREGSWKTIVPVPYRNIEACINGKLVMRPMPCDVVSCMFFRKPFRRGEFTWHGKISEFKEEVESCGKREGPFPSFELRDAPPGRYKAKLGSAGRTFEIIK